MGARVREAAVAFLVAMAPMGYAAAGTSAPRSDLPRSASVQAGAPHSGAAVTVGAWSAAFGAPSTDLASAQRTRGADEPLLVYWMQVQAAPLGVGPALPGTLVANFDAAVPVEGSALRDFTFLAVATPAQVGELEAAVRSAGWVRGEAREQRPGGAFRDVTLALPDGRSGTLSIREGGAAGGMVDGRPSPTVWMHVGG